MKKIYLDYASLTPVDKRVLKEMKKYSSGDYSNPSSIHASGVLAKRAIDSAKERIAKVLHAHPDEIIFTSGGTESNNLVFKNPEINQAESQILISAIEHSSIISKEKTQSKKDGGNFVTENAGKIIKISANKDGVVDLELLKKTITPETSLVSVMYVNNEVGSIQPITEIAKIVRDARKKFASETNDPERKFPLFHTDACQAFEQIPVYVEKLGVDLVSLDGHKVYGPRGVGLLYIKRGTLEIERAGTENVPGIMGLALALEIAEKNREKENTRITGLREFFLAGLKKIRPDINVNGKPEAHILNVSIPGIDNEFFVLQLDAKGIECSTKSACLKDEDESYVLKELGSSSKDSVRFSFGRQTTKGDLKKVLKVIEKIISVRNKK